MTNGNSILRKYAAGHVAAFCGRGKPGRCKKGTSGVGKAKAEPKAADGKESDADLQARHDHVKSLYDTAVRQMQQIQPGGARDRKARFAGSLGFTLSQIKSELEDRKAGAGKGTVKKAKKAKPQAPAKAKVTKPAAATPPDINHHIRNSLLLVDKINNGQAGFPDLVAHVNGLSKLPQPHLAAIARGLGSKAKMTTKDSALKEIHDTLKGKRADKTARYSEKPCKVHKFCGDNKACECCGAVPPGPATKMADVQPDQPGSASPKLARVEGVEIFAAGHHRDKDYTPEHLAKIVDNFKRLSTGDDKLLTPPVVIGHEEPGEQQLVDKDPVVNLDNTGIPAMGIVDKVWQGQKPCPSCNKDVPSPEPGDAPPDQERLPCAVCNGTGKQDILLADFADVLPDVAKLINQRSYRKVSAEIYDDFEHPDGVHHGMTLRRVALLGGEIPQVKTLSDIPLAKFSQGNSCTTWVTMDVEQQSPHKPLRTHVFQHKGKWYWKKFSEGPSKFCQATKKPGPCKGQKRGTSTARPEHLHAKITPILRGGGLMAQHAVLALAARSGDAVKAVGGALEKAGQAGQKAIGKAIGKAGVNVGNALEHGAKAAPKAIGRAVVAGGKALGRGIVNAGDAVNWLTIGGATHAKDTRSTAQAPTTYHKPGQRTYKLAEATKLRKHAELRKHCKAAYAASHALGLFEKQPLPKTILQKHAEQRAPKRQGKKPATTKPQSSVTRSPKDLPSGAGKLIEPEVQPAKKGEVVSTGDTALAAVLAELKSLRTDMAAMKGVASPPQPAMQGFTAVPQQPAAINIMMPAKKRTILRTVRDPETGLIDHVVCEEVEEDEGGEVEAPPAPKKGKSRD